MGFYAISQNIKIIECEKVFYRQNYLRTVLLNVLKGLKRQDALTFSTKKSLKCF